MNIIVLQHIKIEDPGYIKDLMVADGFNLTTIELDEGERIPDDLSKFDGMFCMGGPMDTYMEQEYPWLIEEKKAIKEFVVNLKKPYLGFCLGCQLLGEVVGGKVVKSKPAEIGIMDINFSNEKNGDKLFSKFPDIIKSRDFNISLLNRTFYYESKTSGQPLIKILTGRIPSTPNDSLRLITRGLRRLKRMVRVIPNKVNSVITISVTAGHPRLASELANAVIDELDEFQRRFKTEKIKEKRIFIEGRMVEVKNQLVKVEENLKIFRQQNKNRVSPALMLQEERLERDVTVQTEIYITLLQESELAQIEEVENTRMIVKLDSPMTPLNSSNAILSRRLFLSAFIGFFVSFIVILTKQWLSQNWESTIKPLLDINK